MSVKELHSDIENHFTAFFEDFNYKRSPSKLLFSQEGDGCKKLIFLNIADYQDGLMLEFMLGISQPKVEHQLKELLGKSLQNSYQLTYHVYPEAIDSTLPKRSFLNPKEPTEHYCDFMESFFVNAGFYWLDEYCHSKKLSDMLALKLIQGTLPQMNVHLSALRSLLLKQQLGEPITEDLFFTYLEIMQEKGVPEQEIGLYTQFRQYFIPR